MSDVVSQLEAVIAQIDRRIEHDAICIGVRFPTCPECDCSRTQRLFTEIARTVERMVNWAMVGCYWCHISHGHNPATDGGWAAAFRATQEQETQT